MIRHPNNPVRFYSFRPATLVRWHQQDREVDRYSLWWQLVENEPFPVKKCAPQSRWRHKKAMRRSSGKASTS